MRTLGVAALLLVTCVTLTLAYYKLTPRSYLQIPTAMSGDTYSYQGINREAAVAAAYDYHYNILYVIGKATHLLHVIDIADPAHPALVFSKQFPPSEGKPVSVAVCDHEVAVGLVAQTAVNEGHIRYYNTYEKGSGATDLTLDGYLAVGPTPDHIQYTRDCGSLVIPNRGVPGKDEGGRFVDPEGTVAIMHSERTGNPSLRHVDFQDFNVGGDKHSDNIRQPSKYIPTNVHAHTTFSEDIEPNYAATSASMKYAWVTLPANNAIAKIDLSSALVTEINSLPLKNWTNSPIDASDRDGGVHRRTYPGLKSLRQPTVIKALDVGKKTFLFVGDTGAQRSYSSSAHTFVWTDAVTARSIANSLDNPTLKAEALNDEHLGRLQVSNFDGKDFFSGTFRDLVTFGGRGFSIWDSSDFSAPVFDSDGTLEQYMEAYYKEVFNTEYTTSSGQSPEMTRDAVSDNMGAQVTAMDIKEDNGTTFLVVGTWSTGTLYLYHVNTSAATPVPAFQSIYRAGVTDTPWVDLYKDKTVGDLHIADLGIIPADHSPIDKPLVWVVSEGAGSVSLYEIEWATASVVGGA